MLKVQPQSAPRFHQLAKVPNTDLRTQWDVRNDGDEAGEVRLELLIPPSVVGSSAYLPIGVGEVLTPSLDWNVNITPGQYAPDLQLRARRQDQTTFIAVSHGFSLQVVQQELLVLSQSITVIAPETFNWSGTVQNLDLINNRFFRSTRSQTTNTGLSNIVRRSLDTALAGQIESWSVNTNTGWTHLFGEMWVEEYDSLGNLLWELPPRVPYDIFL